MNQMILSNGRFITPQGIIEGSLVCEDAVIVAVDSVARRGIDLNAALVAPGFIDLHNDGLEGEINPRPGVGLPLDFALANFDRRAAASGITMAFHAITFAGLAKKERSVREANERAILIRSLQRDDTIIEHQVLFRADVWQPDGLDLLFDRASEWDTQLVTLNDHTPGQGQYRDFAIYREAIQKWVQTNTEAELDEHIASKVSHARENPQLAEETFRRCAEAVQDQGILLGSHDDDSPERTEMMYSLGARVAEFPVTIEAAMKARELGMTIIAGAPNIVRGGSHSGNVAAEELVALGLCDILVADYHAPSLLLAVQRLVERDAMGLSDAFALVGRNPARAIGRPDYGELSVGRRATLTIIDTPVDGPWKTGGVIRDGRMRASFLLGEPSHGTLAQTIGPQETEATPAMAGPRLSSQYGGPVLALALVARCASAN